jgi:hypothetical protein
MNPSAQGLLEIYVRDHYVGSTAGVALVRRCRRSNRGTTWDTMLAPVEDEIAEDRETLESLMTELAVEPSHLKAGLGAVGERLGRLKSNGRLFGYSPLSRRPASRPSATSGARYGTLAASRCSMRRCSTRSSNGPSHNGSGSSTFTIAPPRKPWPTIGQRSARACELPTRSRG